MRPDPFLKGVIADVPFVDVLNTMLDSSLPLTRWNITSGESRGSQFYTYIKSYSPYDNVDRRNTRICWLLEG
ncbi:MAG: hypothetical protein CM1200mP27_10780 [Chloroflexota bacterium]|nr:MAG: hypothetical protein CM1200mP27_10780 [Chloroflexota bacterium]